MKLNAGVLVYVLNFEQFLIWLLNREQNITACAHWTKTESTD